MKPTEQEIRQLLGPESYGMYRDWISDMERKRQKEEGMTCDACGKQTLRWTSHDVLGVTHHICIDCGEWEGLYACATCGDAVRHFGQRCDRCKASIEEDRLNRGE